jgi:hypothetical protein
MVCCMCLCICLLQYVCIEPCVLCMGSFVQLVWDYVYTLQLLGLDWRRQNHPQCFVSYLRFYWHSTRLECTNQKPPSMLWQRCIPALIWRFMDCFRNFGWKSQKKSARGIRSRKTRCAKIITTMITMYCACSHWHKILPSIVHDYL